MHSLSTFICFQESGDICRHDIGIFDADGLLEIDGLAALLGSGVPSEVFPNVSANMALHLL